MEEIPCIVSPLKLVYLSGFTKSGCAVIDVSFLSTSGVKVSEIHFKNNYTVSIAIKGKVCGNDENFKTFVEHYQLMKSPHYANDSQNICKINFAELGFAEESLTTLRFILRQPSSIWQRFSIEEIKVYKAMDKDHIIDIEKEQNLTKCDSSLGNIIDSLQKVIDHMGQVQNHHLEFDPAPFDIDGCYDINLLSYT